MTAMLSAIGLRGLLMTGVVAAVGFLAWDYQSTKADLREARQDLAAKKAELEQVKIASDVAEEFSEGQAARNEVTKAKIKYIRRRPDADEAAAAIILDAIDGLRDRPSGISPSKD